jgi:hypothetical protein
MEREGDGQGETAREGHRDFDLVWWAITPALQKNRYRCSIICTVVACEICW